jgi:hypothetical protein
MSYKTQESIPVTQSPPSLALASADLRDFDVVSEKHQSVQKKSLFKPNKKKFKSMVVTSQKLELTKRITCSGDSDIFEPFQD